MTDAARLRVAILTVSDAASRGERDDRAGSACAVWAERRGALVAARAVVPDETTAIVAQLLAWCDAGDADLVLTTGGTGLGPRDVTPEATRDVLERSVPGISELLRSAPRDRVPTSVLSRGVAGVAGRTLVVNVAGSTGAARDAVDCLAPLLGHVVEQLRGGDH